MRSSRPVVLLSPFRLVSGGTAIVGSGGIADIGGAFGGTVNVSGANAVGQLSGAIVSGGVLETSAGGQADVYGSGNLLRGVTVKGTGLIESGGTLTVSGGALGAGAVLETVAGGTVFVSGTFTNAGALYASGSGSLIEIASGATVNGGTVKVGNGIVDIVTSGSESVSFQSGSGGLEISDHASDLIAYSGKISGFGSSGNTDTTQYVDLVDVASGASVISLSYASAASHTSGTLTVSSGGTVVAKIDLIGTYSSGNFQIGSGAGGTVEITDPAVVNGGEVHSANIALFGSYIAGFAAGGRGGFVVSHGLEIELPPPLVHPHA